MASARNAERKLLDTVEALARSRQVLDLAYDFRLPVLRARLALAQLDEAAIEQQQVGGQRGVGEIGVLHAARRRHAQMDQRTGFEHRVVQT